MRLHLYVHTAAKEIPWPAVLQPGRGLAYSLLAQAAPELGERLHAQGHGCHHMAPFGHGAPIFPTAQRERGHYPADGRGAVEFGSPLPEVVEALARGLSTTRVLDWGGVALVVDGVEVLEPPAFASGHATFMAVTPVVMKASGRDATGTRVSRQAWVLPGEPEWDVYFAGNLRRKAETLGLDAGVVLESIGRIGPKRSFVTGGSGPSSGRVRHVGKKVGAPVTVGVSGPPEALAAIWSWGIGQANSAGFGWVAA